MKKIKIQNEANIHANGEHNNGNCDSCIILETGEVFTSQVDLANRLNVTSCAISNVICGRARTCKGYHIVSVSRLAEGVDVVLSRLRETSTMEEDAKRWRAYQAEQEAIRKAEEKRLEEERKAEEKRQAEIANAKAKVARLTENAQKYEEMWRQTMNDLTAAEQHLESLVGAEDEEKENAA